MIKSEPQDSKTYPLVYQPVTSEAFTAFSRNPVLPISAIYATHSPFTGSIQFQVPHRVLQKQQRSMLKVISYLKSQKVIPELLLPKTIPAKFSDRLLIDPVLCSDILTSHFSYFSMVYPSEFDQLLSPLYVFFF